MSMTSSSGLPAVAPANRYSRLPAPFSVAELTETVGQLRSTALGDFPVAEFLGSFWNGPNPTPYFRIAPAQAEALARTPTPALWLKLALAEALLDALSSGRLLTYPERIQHQFDIQLRLLRQEWERRPETYFQLDSDLYRKDLAVAAGRMFPAGPQLVELCGGVPLSLFRTGGPSQALALAALLLRRPRLRPFYEMHLDPRRMAEFTPAGWERCYLRVADLLRHHPDAGGLMSVTWWYDPQVVTLSPQLAFLRQVPLANGGRVFRYAADAAAKEYALFRSPERQKAYEDGTYLPTSYVMLWMREDLLAWAANRQD